MTKLQLFGIGCTLLVSFLMMARSKGEYEN